MGVFAPTQFFYLAGEQYIHFALTIKNLHLSQVFVKPVLGKCEEIAKKPSFNEKKCVFLNKIEIV